MIPRSPKLHKCWAILFWIQSKSMWCFSGTFCINQQDFLPLVKCIREEIEIAEYCNQKSYASYLQMSPNITDTENERKCRLGRDYFGYEGNFINDEQICDNIAQVSFSLFCFRWQRLQMEKRDFWLWKNLLWFLLYILIFWKNSWGLSIILI